MYEKRKKQKIKERGKEILQKAHQIKKKMMNFKEPTKIQEFKLYEKKKETIRERKTKAIF